MLIHTKGNLLEMAAAGEFDAIVHGCNCQADMGGGIAKPIAEKYPEARSADEEFHMSCESLPVWQLGNITAVNTDDGFAIINGYTQLYGGSGSFSYAALELVLMKVSDQFTGKRIGLPYIGCGIAGGDQNKILDIMELFAIKFAKTGGTVTLVEFG